MKLDQAKETSRKEEGGRKGDGESLTTCNYPGNRRVCAASCCSILTGSFPLSLSPVVSVVSKLCTPPPSSPLLLMAPGVVILSPATSPPPQSQPILIPPHPAFPPSNSTFLSIYTGRRSSIIMDHFRRRLATRAFVKKEGKIFRAVVIIVSSNGFLDNYVCRDLAHVGLAHN